MTLCTLWISLKIHINSLYTIKADLLSSSSVVATRQQLVGFHVLYSRISCFISKFYFLLLFIKHIQTQVLHQHSTFVLLRIQG